MGVSKADLLLLTKHRLSNNVGVVNQNWRTLQPALDEERHFALVEGVPIQPRLARNQGSGLDSVHLILFISIHPSGMSSAAPSAAEHTEQERQHQQKQQRR